MDSQHRRRGFIKGMRLFSFSRASKSCSGVQYTSRMKPSYQSSASVPPITYLVDHKDTKPKGRPKVSLFVPEYHDSSSFNELESYLSSAGDENVNMKAASYISTVREKFKLERMNSERKISHD